MHTLLAAHEQRQLPNRYRWRLNKFLDNEHADALAESYQTALDKELTRTLGTEGDLENMTVPEQLRAITQVITAAAKSAIGLRKVGSGKLNGWWNKDIAAAIRRRRSLYKQYQSNVHDAGARLLLAEQRSSEPWSSAWCGKRKRRTC
jgi:hypothetical protein